MTKFLGAGTSISMVFAVLNLSACGQSLFSNEKDKSNAGQVGEASSENDDSKKEAVVEPTQEERVPCKVPDGHDTTLNTISDVVNLINVLPLPVTIPCLLEVIERPIKMNATSSILSVQPAVGDNNPRFFLFLTSDLMLSIVPDGEGSKTIEFSYLVGSGKTVKGELGFPVEARLAVDAPYSRILAPSGVASNCSGCHANEERAGEGFPENAYQSDGIRPFDHQVIADYNLKIIADGCAEVDSPRCEIINSLYRGAEPEVVPFPSIFPTWF